MPSLDGVANARIPISDQEAATRERIHDPRKLCRVCGESYEYSLRIVYGPEGTNDTCEHDSTGRPPNADRNAISRIAERAIQAETNPFS